MSFLSTFDIAQLTDGQQLFLCMVLSAVSAFFDVLSDGPARLNPYSSFQSVFGGAIVGALVFFTTIEMDNMRTSHRMALALILGLAWRKVIAVIRSGSVVHNLLERVLGVPSTTNDPNSNKEGRNGNRTDDNRSTNRHQ